MIRVELPIIVLIYFFVLLAALLSLSIFTNGVTKTQKRSLALPGSLHDLCLYFRRQDEAEFIRCPRCGSQTSDKKLEDFNYMAMFIAAIERPG